jgi:outer membrane biosynthesis protein TonB
MRCSTPKTPMLLSASTVFLLAAANAQTPPPLLTRSPPEVTRPSWMSARSSKAQKGATAAMHPFKKHLLDQIGSAWYRSVEANSQKIALGTVRIALTASPNGNITKLRVLSNTSNKLLAQISISAIRQAKIPPIPKELLTHGKFEDEISFTMFPK